ncbi:uncharacterized protein G2W53_018171 [Senna tora]|uniref:Uncharacterized protein n=1 Tax=Senna tora TaxID=362788 RepID=A0A834TT58_9FABA|nr:uncharacterized protein G2W53_018171 [Senna tora]
MHPLAKTLMASIAETSAKKFSPLLAKDPSPPNQGVRQLYSTLKETKDDFAYPTKRGEPPIKEQCKQFNQTMAFYSSTSNSPVQRRDIQCNAFDKGKRIKKHCDQNLQRKSRGPQRAEDTKKWDLKRDDQKLKEKNLDLKENNLELREENFQLKEENLGLRGEGQMLKDEMTRMERRELELRKENEAYRLQLAEKQFHIQNLMAKLKALGDNSRQTGKPKSRVNHCLPVRVSNYPSLTSVRLFSPYWSSVLQPNLIEFGL